MNVQSGQIHPGSAAFIFMFHSDRTAGLARLSRMFAATCLDASLLVRGDDELIILQWLTIPFTSVQIEQATGLFGETRIAREDPTAVIPGTDSIVMQPAPKCAAADRSPQTRSLVLQRDNGSACVAGSSQAQAFTCTTNSGGKSPGATRTNPFV